MIRNWVILLLGLTPFLGCQDQSSSKSLPTSLPSSQEVENQSSHYFTSQRDKSSLLKGIKLRNSDEEDQFVLGRSFFTIPWVEAPSATMARDGLGPLYSANSCIHCHKGGGGGLLLEHGKMSRSMVMRVGINTKQLPMRTMADPNYGVQLSQSATSDLRSEVSATAAYLPVETDALLNKVSVHYSLHYAPLETQAHVALHRAQPLIGLGFIEEITDEDILANEDASDSDGDGISGRANWVMNPQNHQTELGRYTWKASASTLLMQVCNAAINDMGLTSPLYPDENCAPNQRECKQAYRSKQIYDLPLKRAKAIAFYLSHLKVPYTATKNQTGKQLFTQIGCVKCHQPNFTTRHGVEIAPYSDFLLHDMGDALSDGHRLYLADPNEFRTQPLWGLQITKVIRGEYALLHDGRARSIHEAILWHGGEASAIKNAYKALSPSKQQSVINFIEEL